MAVPRGVISRPLGMTVVPLLSMEVYSYPAGAFAIQSPRSGRPHRREIIATSRKKLARSNRGQSRSGLQFMAGEHLRELRSESRSVNSCEFSRYRSVSNNNGAIFLELFIYSGFLHDPGDSTGSHGIQPFTSPIIGYESCKVGRSFCRSSICSGPVRTTGHDQSPGRQ